MSLPYSFILVGEITLLSLTLSPLLRLGSTAASTVSYSYYEPSQYPPSIAFMALSKRSSKELLSSSMFLGWMLTTILLAVYVLPEAVYWMKRMRQLIKGRRAWRGDRKVDNRWSTSWMVGWASFGVLKLFMICVVLSFLTQAASDTRLLAKEASFQSPSFYPNPPDRYPLNDPVELAIALSASANDLDASMKALMGWLVLTLFEALGTCFLLGQLNGKR